MVMTPALVIRSNERSCSTCAYLKKLKLLNGDVLVCSNPESDFREEEIRPHPPEELWCWGERALVRCPACGTLCNYDVIPRCPLCFNGK